VRQLRRLAIAVFVGIAIGSVLATENALHIWVRPQPQPEDAAALAHATGSSWQPVGIQAADATPLDAWLFTPIKPNHAAVILLHGVGDTRLGTTEHARFLLRAGYVVLAPDARGHGASGGKIITYGIRESSDVHAWADWLFQHKPIDRLYGLGASMGGAILLESLPREPRFRAVVAECPFASFEEVAYDRLSQASGIARPVFWPIVNFGFVYARVRYGVNMYQASPSLAIRGTHIPILLIHGTADTNIPIRHSRELHAVNPAATQLWEVPHAHHVDSLPTAPAAYMDHVLEWFRR
jgi:alpha-beta hydrolase superfamily lysophospholipase